MTKAKVDLLALIEQVYDVERDESVWLDQVLDAAAPLLDRGLGVVGLLYDASDPRRTDFQTAAWTRRQPGDADLIRSVANTTAAVDREFSGNMLRTRVCTTASEMGGVPYEHFRTMVEPLGVSDVCWVNGFDATSSGCLLAAILSVPERLAPRRRWLLGRVAAHLAAGDRLRRRLAALPPKHASQGATQLMGASEAVVAPNGTIAHAEGPAQARVARDLLSEAVRRIEKLRSKRRSVNEERVLDDWRALVGARWTMVDLVERDGKRYMLARRNDTPTTGIEALSPRERQVVRQACLGRHNKLIAYELGLSASTVRVLVSRAARKLGAASRAELIVRAAPLLVAD
jgi:DNA-binding CsgD family transcriptional regulator